jgi:hypothetical protein
MGVERGMTNEECIEAGAYAFRERFTIGGCMKMFAGRNALNRHVDNPNLSCIGHIDTYYLLALDGLKIRDGRWDERSPPLSPPFAFACS